MTWYVAILSLTVALTNQMDDSSWSPNCTLFCEEWIRAEDTRGYMKGLESMSEGQVLPPLFYGAFCNAGVCVIFPNFYNKFHPPRPLTNGPRDHPECQLTDTENNAHVVYVSMDPLIQNIVYEDQAGEIDMRMNLGFEWSDPGLDICVCADVGQDRIFWDQFEAFLIGNDLEKYIWTPDLYLWNSDDFHREGALTLLNDIWIRQHEGCPPTLFISYQTRASVRCNMTLMYYPFDKNVCHVKLGSASFPDSIIKFETNHPDVRRMAMGEFYVFERELEYDQQYEYKNAPSPSKPRERFKIAGVSVILERRANMVIYKVITPLIILSFVNIITWLVPHRQNKLGLLTCVLVSYVLAMTQLLEQTPKIVNGFLGENYNFLTLYTHYNVWLVAITFIQSCLMQFFQRLFPKLISDTVIATWDLVFFVIHGAALALFNLYWWIFNPNFPSPQSCHNVPEENRNCET